MVESQATGIWGKESVIACKWHGHSQLCPAKAAMPPAVADERVSGTWPLLGEMLAAGPADRSVHRPGGHTLASDGNAACKSVELCEL